MDNILLLTGAVKPKPIPFLSLTDHITRASHYREAIQFYITKSMFTKIVFVENTGYAEGFDYLLAIAKKNGKILEILSFSGDYELLKKAGKGVGEFENIDFALKNSKLITDQSYITKVTGRYIIQNINEFYYSHHSYDVSFNRIPSYRMIDAFVFSFKPQIWKDYFIELKNYVDDPNGIYFEHVIFEGIQNNAISVRMLPALPKYEQISGTTGLLSNSINIKTKIDYILGLSSVTSLQSRLYHQMYFILRQLKKTIKRVIIKKVPRNKP
jgi:hypothetical protein